jgi:hypothetical protein
MYAAPWRVAAARTGVAAIERPGHERSDRASPARLDRLDANVPISTTRRAWPKICFRESRIRQSSIAQAESVREDRATSSVARALEMDQEGYGNRHAGRAEKRTQKPNEGAQTRKDAQQLGTSTRPLISPTQRLDLCGVVYWRNI